MEREGPLTERLRRVIENLKHPNRFGVVAVIAINGNNPHRTGVLIDRGKDDIDRDERNFQDIEVSTQKIVQENWRVQDLVSVDRFGNITRIASYSELKERGADIEKIYEGFGDWVATEKILKERQEIVNIIANFSPEGWQRLLNDK